MLRTVMACAFPVMTMLACSGAVTPTAGSASTGSGGAASTSTASTGSVATCSKYCVNGFCSDDLGVCGGAF